MSIVSCPVCGEDEDLTGEPDGATIAVRCGACAHRWVRDPSPTCRRCGRRDLRAVKRAVWERARGEQLSVVGASTVYLCPDCDRNELDATDDGRIARLPEDFPKGEKE